jgi:exopolysaccharide biosynthesis WecB/TagA/CpsF family protein
MLKKIFDINFSDIHQDTIISNIICDKYNNKVIVTPNVDHIVRLHKDNKFREEYIKADVFINDSRIVKILSRTLGSPLEYVTPGSDITRSLFSEYHEISNNEFCVIGATKKDISEISKIYKTNEIHHYIPSFGFINREQEILKCIEFCKKLPKCIYFIAVGSPQQEILALRLKNAGVEGTFLCVGASLLFLSGSEKRAPKILQNANLEWLYRLIQSPKRLWKRYLLDGPYIFKITAIAIFNNRNKNRNKG